MRLITWPTAIESEVAILCQLLAETQTIVHIRKPYMTDMDFARYLNKFSHAERQRFVAHQHYKIACDYGLRYFHSPTRLREAHLADNFMQFKLFSTSTHSWDEFNQLDKAYSAAFLSPVFPSISKTGYGVAERIKLKGRSNWHTQLIALGGIDRQRIATLVNSDFDDFALCGAVWQSADPLREALICYDAVVINKHLKNDL